MPGNDLQTIINVMLRPWHDTLADPGRAQGEVLNHLLKDYAQTEYGARHGAPQVKTLDDYRAAFPVTTYEDYQPLIQRVMAGEVSLLLTEQPDYDTVLNVVRQAE